MNNNYLLFFSYIVKRLKNQTKCLVCINALSIEDGQNSLNPAADLVNLKTRGFLIHPNSQILNLIKSLEISVEKFSDSLNVFEDTYEDFFKTENPNLKWECSTHKTDIFTNIFVIFITMRMQQHSYAQNIECKKLNRTKMKLSKLVTS